MSIVRSLLFTIVMLVLPGALLAGAAEKPSYDMLLAQLKGGDSTIDFRALRYAYADAPLGYVEHGRPKSTHERWANDEKYEDLRCNRLRPQQARCPCADTGVAPTDDRKGVMKSMTAQHKPGDEQKPTKGGYSQQGAKAAGLLNHEGRWRGDIWNAQSSDSCNAEEDGTEPDRHDEPERARRVTGDDRSSNESGRPGASYPPVFESLA